MNTETIALLNQVKARGINTFALLAIYRKRSKLQPEIPDEVLQKMCHVYLQTDKVDHSFPYFLRVLQSETEKYFSNKNEQEGKRYNKREGFSSSIKQLLSQI